MSSGASSGVALVTGGTGLLGSHIAERLSQQQTPVRALVRPGSAVRFLESLGVELVVGDLTDPDACQRAARGVDTIYHAAAKVGDWGTWAEFQAGCMDATANLARAALSSGVRRFVHISSTSAYGHPREGGPAVEETAELGQNLWPIWDYYTRSKVECEQLLWDLARVSGLPLSIVRPSWLYGERDRITVARIVRKLKQGGIPLIGRGDNPLSAIYAGDVAHAAILAANDPQSVGEAYNITDQGPITQREFFNLYAEACGAPAVRTRRSYRLVFAGAFVFELFGRLTGRVRPPLITRYATWLMGRNLSYSTAKARERLGWRPELSYRESIGRTVRWYLQKAEEANSGRP
jgi:nucleoside-diphosphate-sugar epimerase